MKKAFVLSGGGAKGIFQVGAMQRLAELGVHPDLIYGTSTGALNAAGMGFAGINELVRVWMRIRGRDDILSLNWWKIFWATGVYNTKPLRKKIDQIISFQDKSGQGKPATQICEAFACQVDLLSGEVSYISSKRASRKEFADAVEASSAIPTIMEPVGTFVDGGVREQTPLRKAIEDGADTIYVILCNPLVQNPVRWTMETGFLSLVKVGLRSIDIMEHEIFLNDILTCLEYNERPDKRKIDLKVFAPKKVLFDTLEFNHEKFTIGLAAGREAVGDLTTSIPEELLALAVQEA